LNKARSAESLEGFLALALEPPAAESDDGRPVAEQIRDLLESLGKLDDSPDWTIAKSRDIRRRIHSLVAHDPAAHLALMELLKTADEDQAHRILGFLVWSPWVGSSRSREVTDRIHAAAREMMANDPSVVRREGAVRVLFRYGDADRKGFDYGLERLDAEPSVAVRDVLLEEMSRAGLGLGLTREEAAPFVGRLRRRLDDGEAWCADSLARWSTDAEDFRRISDQLATERDPGKRQDLVNAFSGDTALVRDRAGPARDVLIARLSDPAENEDVRDLARSILTKTYGPLDAATAGAVRRYDAGRKGR
jgi:hypothetical protein